MSSNIRSNDAAAILEKLVNSQKNLASAAKPAKDAQAYSFSADLSEMRAVLIKEIFALFKGRKEIV